jgi:hypothetical protein
VKRKKVGKSKGKSISATESFNSWKAEETIPTTRKGTLFVVVIVTRLSVPVSHLRDLFCQTIYRRLDRTETKRNRGNLISRQVGNNTADDNDGAIMSEHSA